MRAILFKAKRKDNKEWVEGGYFLEPYTDKVFIIQWNSTGLGFNEFIEVIPETICQYTGLINKDGKKIWENDICHYHDTKHDICVVRFGSYSNNSHSKHIGFFTDWEAYKWMLRSDLGFWAEEREIEVIGNIFDNPELLEE